MYLLSVAGLIACKDASLFEAFSCPWTPSSTFYKLREIERTGKALPRLLVQTPLLLTVWRSSHSPASIPALSQSCVFEAKCESLVSKNQ